ncbi:Phosphomannomutase/phosphoglucomutase [Rickettsiales bacterium Ac37b]|nr:Phosphomannomutase/phosphoglucomutase [Rickettsiales bacterium Ac37b]
MYDVKCFKAYDIRGRVPEELNEELAYNVGYAYSKVFQPRTVVVGYDVRLESNALANAVIKGLNHAHTNVINIGLCGTEEVYFHTFNRYSEGVGGGIMITASHNPKGYNGMKLVREQSKPISGDDGLFDILDYIRKFPQIMAWHDIDKSYNLNNDYNKTSYIEHLLTYINYNNLKPLKIVVNPGNSSAGVVIKLLQRYLPFEFIYIHDEPDGNFPNGVPNPLLPENRLVTSEAIKLHKADLGVAWDGDFDRCFLFDEKGEFIEGYYIVGLLAEVFLKKFPKEKIIHDPRLYWNTVDIANNFGGQAIQSKTGHAFIKASMRNENAIYGGEMSAHHYFRDFAYCDSGMIPWLLISELISMRNISLAQLVAEQINHYPCSGEMNYTVHNKNFLFAKILEYFEKFNPKIDYTDGLSLEFDDWRFNIRGSNTEPLVRLNIETRGDKVIIDSYKSIIESIIENYGSNILAVS